MNLLLNGRRLDLFTAQFFGGIQRSRSIEDLYRLADGTWVLHTQNPVTLQEPSVRPLTQDDAIDWLIDLRRNQSVAQPGPLNQTDGFPENAVPYDEPARLTAGRKQWSCPPPVGQIVRTILSPDCTTVGESKERQDRLLQPGLVLDRVFWPAAVDEDFTKGFKNHSHDDLLLTLRTQLEKCLIESPRLSIFQSLQDRGCDLLIEWGLQAKFGVQLKSHRDIGEEDFARNTLAQIQDSRQHGLQKLYVVLAGDLASQQQKIGGLHSRVSAMNDPYVTVVPPERAWPLLFPS
jgi:hypothetical protein